MRRFGWTSPAIPVTSLTNDWISDSVKSNLG